MKQKNINKNFKFEKIKTCSWERQKFSYKCSSGFYFRYSKGFNKVTIDLIEKAIRAKLFLDDGSLSFIMTQFLIYKESRIFHVVLVSLTNKVTVSNDFKAIGIVKNGEIHVYVNPIHRRLGIGSRIIDFLRFKNVKITNWNVGIKGSHAFYKINGFS